MNLAGAYTFRAASDRSYRMADSLCTVTVSDHIPMGLTHPALATRRADG